MKKKVLLFILPLIVNASLSCSEENRKIRIGILPEIDAKLVNEAYHTSSRSVMFGIIASPKPSIHKLDVIKNEPAAISRRTLFH